MADKTQNPDHLEGATREEADPARSEGKAAPRADVAGAEMSTWRCTRCDVSYRAEPKPAGAHWTRCGEPACKKRHWELAPRRGPIIVGVPAVPVPHYGKTS